MSDPAAIWELPLCTRWARRATATTQTAENHFQAVRTCDEVLAALADYFARDEVIERLEFAIMDDRLEALLRAREAAGVAA